MAHQGKTPAHIGLDECNHIEKPLLDQLVELGRQVIDLEMKPGTDAEFP